MHQCLQGATFHIEHIVPRCRAGSSLPDNLALACPGCNLHKADRVEAEDPETGAVTEFFHPRRHDWRDHFRWVGHMIVGTTAIGRTTVACLHLNHLRRIRIRQAEEAFALFPP
jgi:hypothetical protein